MAHFRGTMHGHRGGVSRLGSKDSGLQISADGWRSGVSVNAFEEDGVDYFTVTLTSGSGHGYGVESRNLGTFYRKGSKLVKRG